MANIHFNYRKKMMIFMWCLSRLNSYRHCDLQHVMVHFMTRSQSESDSIIYSANHLWDEERTWKLDSPVGRPDMSGWETLAVTGPFHRFLIIKQQHILVSGASSFTSQRKWRPGLNKWFFIKLDPCYLLGWLVQTRRNLKFNSRLTGSFIMFALSDSFDWETLKVIYSTFNLGGKTVLQIFWSCLEKSCWRLPLVL